jgi:hypothetical protein
MESVVAALKQKFVAMMDGQPLIKVDSLYICSHSDLRIKLSAKLQATSPKTIDKVSGRRVYQHPPPTIPTPVTLHFHTSCIANHLNPSTTWTSFLRGCLSITSLSRRHLRVVSGERWRGRDWRNTHVTDRTIC